MNTVREYIENAKINNIEDVKNVIKYLCDRYYVDYYGDEIYTFKTFNNTNTTLAYVERPFKIDSNGKFFRNGQRYSRATKGWKLSINNLLFSKKQDEIKKTIIHEFAHILQYEWMNDDELSNFKEINTAKIYGHVYITSYKPNMLELQAECFTIDLMGASCDSFKSAKNHMADIKEILDCMWSYSLWDL